VIVMPAHQWSLVYEWTTDEGEPRDRRHRTGIRRGRRCWRDHPRLAIFVRLVRPG